MNSYDLTRPFWDFSFENPELVKPTHVAIFHFAIEHCNRLGWKSKFGFPTTMAMEAIGVKSYKTYISALNDLVDWGFIKMVEKSKNQHSSNVIALVKNTKAHTKALDKAMLKHGLKQVQSTVSIIKPINHKPINKETIYICFDHLSLSNDEFEKLSSDFTKEQIDSVLMDIENYSGNKKYKSLYLTALKWLKKNKQEQPQNIDPANHKIDMAF